MPYKSEVLKLAESQDRRVKITTKQKEEIIRLYKTGNYTHKSLAQLYNVSRSLITLTVNKNCANRVKERNKNHWKDYHNPKDHNDAMKKLRRYKQELYLNGELY